MNTKEAVGYVAGALIGAVVTGVLVALGCGSWSAAVSFVFAVIGGSIGKYFDRKDEKSE
ncbi:MAG TPA: hypothetical protein GXZ86_00390 [Clostridiales bacterium]|jgi:uncharacterized protein YcfJ|nr:hypothetical protein [Clostridiales bacterium]